MITFGIIGTAEIAYRFIKGAKYCEGMRITVVGSRSLKRADQFVAQVPFLRAAGSYEEVLQDPGIDAVYIATPNFTHYDLVMRALQAGKHVMCEKPLMLHAEDVRKCFAYAKSCGLLLMEAMKPCFLPTTQKAKQWITEGRIGTLSYIRASYCHHDVQPFLSGWHQDRSLGGGILYDIGVYPIGFVHALLSESVSEISCVSRFLSSSCDCFNALTCRYGETIVQMLCACVTPMKNEAVIYGSEGSITIENFWKSERAFLHSTSGDEEFCELHNQSEFQYEIRYFCESIKKKEVEQPFMGEEMSLRNAALIDQVLRKEG